MINLSIIKTTDNCMTDRQRRTTAGGDRRSRDPA